MASPMGKASILYCHNNDREIEPKKGRRENSTSSRDVGWKGENGYIEKGRTFVRFAD